MKKYIRSEEFIEEEIDDSADEWDPYHGKRYRIDCGDYQTKYTDSPNVAIRYWFQGSEKHTGECAIMARYKKDALALAKSVTPELLERFNEKYPCGYKLDWLYAVAQRFVNNNARSFLGDGQYGDQVEPFTYG